MRRITQLWQPDGWHFSAASAVVVGASAGCDVWIFKQLISLFTGEFAAIGALLAPLGVGAIVLPPVLGGLIVGLIVRFWIGEERLHGVAGIIESSHWPAGGCASGGLPPRCWVPRSRSAAALQSAPKIRPCRSAPILGRW
jgi:hypothetical protein